MTATAPNPYYAGRKRQNAISMWLCGRRYVGTVQAARAAEVA